MQINYEIIYLDENDNYIRTSSPPPYLFEVFAHLQNKTVEEIDESFFASTQYFCEYNVQLETTIADVLDCYLEYLACDKTKFYRCSSMVYIPIKQDIIHVPQYTFRISKLFETYGDNTSLTVLLVFSLLQGVVCRDGQIRYYMNSHEAGHHHVPHVHVKVGSNYEAAIGIMNSEILAGELPPKYRRKIIKTIANNRTHLIHCWNCMTDGMHIDINCYLGETQFLKN